MILTVKKPNINKLQQCTPHKTKLLKKSSKLDNIEKYLIITKHMRGRVGGLEASTLKEYMEFP